MKYFLFLFVIFLVSCENQNRQSHNSELVAAIDTILGTKLEFPELYQIYDPFARANIGDIKAAGYDYKIYSRVDVSCGSCIASIQQWNEVISEFEKYNVPVILICTSDNDNFDEFKIICESETSLKDFRYPFFLVPENEFLNKNSFMNVNPGFETVLTNQNHEVVLLGDPRFSNDSKELYSKVLRDRQ